MIVDLHATPYERNTKGDVKRMRKEGKLPAVFYGHKEKSKRIYVDHKEFRKVLDILKEQAITVNLKIKDKGYHCVIKTIQHNPITDELLHIDFQHIHKKEKIRATIPIHIHGEAPGIKQGGILDQHLHDIVVRCLPADMPSHIDVNVGALDLGDTVHLSDLKMENVEFEMPDTTTVVSVLIPRAVAVEVKPAEEVAEGEEVKEGEEGAPGEEEGKEREKEKEKEGENRKVSEKPKK
jgi:large subunit ribosomal protein L25